MFDLPDDEILPLSKEHVFFTWSAQAKVNPIAVDHACVSPATFPADRRISEGLNPVRAAERCSCGHSDWLPPPALAADPLAAITMAIAASVRRDFHRA